MSDIPGPKPLADDHDRVLDCEFALEPAFHALIDKASEKNWPDEDIALALLSLASNHIRANASNFETSRAIDKAKLEVASRMRHFH